MEMNCIVIQICFHLLVLKGRNALEEVDFRMHLEASLTSSDFAVVRNSKVDFLSFLPCSTERVIRLL